MRLIMKIKVVNALVVSFLFISSCGFQLNRNKAELIDGARSVSLVQVKNGSYIPSLDISLKSNLLEKLSQKSVSIKSGSQGDLLIEVLINNITSNRSKYSLVDSVQTYLHSFSATARVTIRQNRKWLALTQEAQSKDKTSVKNTEKSKYPKAENISASYSIKSTDEDLSQTDIDTYRVNVIKSLCDTIISQLSVTF